MKRYHILLIAAMLGILTFGNSEKANAQADYYDRYDDQYGASYQDFYDGLAPYGQWLNDPQYGYVWLPNVGQDFRPYYTNGYWAMTQYGNTWVSNYDWGWATFHYGRWTFDNYYGWLWIPDTQWAPAWVSWRSNNNYYGWAPMGPGVGIDISLGLIPNDWWIFLSPTYFYEPRFQRYCNNDWAFNRNIYRQTTYINYTYNNNRNGFYTGPRAEDYRRRTGRQTSMFNIENNSRRGSSRVSGNRINMYRPEINKTVVAAPRRIVQTERGISQRPQAYNNVQPAGRQWVLNQTATTNDRSERANGNRAIQPNVPNRNSQNNIRQNTDYPAVRNAQDQRMQNAQNQQGNDNRQRAMQTEEANRQRIQQQRDAQMTQQRNEEQNRQRALQSEEANRQRMQQQRDAQMMQQHNEEQNRQRAYQAEEANRQRMQQQRDAQINQQREQENNRARQMEQQRRMQEAPAQPREQRTRESRPTMNDQRNNGESNGPSYNAPQRSEGSGSRRR